MSAIYICKNGTKGLKIDLDIMFKWDFIIILPRFFFLIENKFKNIFFREYHKII